MRIVRWQICGMLPLDFIIDIYSPRMCINLFLDMYVYVCLYVYICVCMYIHPRIGRYKQEDNYCKELDHVILEVW